MTWQSGGLPSRAEFSPRGVRDGVRGLQFLKNTPNAFIEEIKQGFKSVKMLGMLIIPLGGGDPIPRLGLHIRLPLPP